MHILPDKKLFRINASFEQLSYIGVILDKSAQAFVLFDTMGQVIFINKGFRKLLGYSRKDVIKLKWDEDISLPETYALDQEMKEKLIKTGQAQRYEKEYLHKNGTLIPVEILLHAVLIKEEVLLYALITDISGRKQLEQEVLAREIDARKQMQYWNNLINNMNMLFIARDNDYKITYVNQKSLEILGYLPEEMIGQYLWSFVPVKNRPAFQQEAESRMPSDKGSSKLMTLQDKQGYEHIIRFSTAPIHEDTKIIGEMALAEDITTTLRMEKDLFTSHQDLSRVEVELIAANQQLMATEEELRYQLEELEKNKKRLDDAHQQLAAILDFLPDATAVINRDGQVTLWNQAMEELTGVKAHEVLGQADYAYSVPFYGKKQAALINMVLDGNDARDQKVVANESNRVLSMEKYFPLILDGAYLHCKASALLDNTGQAVGAIETIRDITKQKEIEKELITSEARFRNIIERIEDGYYEVDLEGTYTYSNPYLQNYIGYSQEELLGLNFSSLMDKQNRLKVKKTFNKVFQTRQTIHEFGWYIRNREGNQLYVETTLSPIIENDQVIGFRGIVRDLTQRQLAQEALAMSEARYRAIVEDQTELICRFTPDEKLTFVNEAYCRYFKQNREKFIDSRFLPNILEEDRPILEAALKGLNADNPVSTTEIRVLIDGKICWNQWNHRIINDENCMPVNIQSVGRDISEKKEAIEKLEYLSLHDSLTGLYNRSYFEEEMRRLDSNRHNPVALIIFDVDGLKLVNDTLGHKQGDELLINTANIIRRCFREGDMIARVGGDEFAVLLPTTTEALVEEAIKNIEEKIAAYNISHPELPLSLSAGYAIKKDKSYTMNNVFKEADNKMYRQKLHSSQSNRSVIVHTMMKALEARDYITEGHGDRLQKLVSAMAETINMPDASIKDLRLLAQFHDIGKVGVPDAILFKKGPLNSQEYQEMQRHSEIGHRIALSAPDLVLIADWILKHHEWWNGDGYPLGLSGNNIPLECRILAIADAFDAMTHDRPYRKAISEQEAIKEINMAAGMQFDPVLVSVFMQVINKS